MKKINKNTEYERFTKKVYEALLKHEGHIVTVEHNKIIQGKASKHQIDVYWEYKVAGVLHRVAIECKNYGSKNPVGIGKVRDFYGALADIGNINGIMVTKRKYQSGAMEFARKYGIDLKTLDKPFQILGFGVTSFLPVFKNIHYSISDHMIIASPAVTEEIVTEILKKEDAWKTLEVCKIDGTESKTVVQMIKDLPGDSKAEVGRSIRYDFNDRYLQIPGVARINLTSLVFNYDVEERHTDLMDQVKELEVTILRDVFDGKIIQFNENGITKH